ncbi:right-handed parallel beta-helix repeat-containing protein [bacterium]|nr:right-handed parallel beta-helix repeat-containing protein [bacterium]
MRFLRLLVVFLFPFLLFAKGEIHKTRGYFSIEVKKSGVWQEIEKVSFSEFKSTKKVVLSEKVSNIRLIKVGGGASHIDMVSLEGRTPQGNSLLSSRDKALYHVKGETLLHFNKAGRVFEMSARIEPEKILPFAFDFPKINQFKKIKHNSSFYRYKMNAKKPTPLFSEKTVPGSGHPVGNTIGYVWNDAKNLYVKVDFTPDNTMDGGKDYTSVHIRQNSSVKTFTMSADDTSWGLPKFQKSPNADYPHKVYDYKIPLSEISVNDNKIEMAFSAYGTAAPQLGLTDVNRFNYQIYAQRYQLVMLAGNREFPDYTGSFGKIHINGATTSPLCQTMEKSDDGRMFTCDKGVVSMNGISVAIKRTLFVPTGKGYARSTTTVSNPSGSSITLDIQLENDYITSDTTYYFQKSGGSLDDPGAWVTMDTTRATLVKLGEVKYGNGGDVSVPTVSHPSRYETTWSVTIPAGESRTVMNYFTQNSTFADVTAVINALYTQADSAMFVNLDSHTLASVINWQLDDNDGDGMIDQWEDTHGLDSSTDDSALDKDEDGLTNLEEFNLGSHPDKKDSDEDGIEDKTEYDSVPQTDLTDSDSDNDGFHDGDEILYGSDPLDGGDYPQIGAGTYFVNPASSSLGNGTETNPWRKFEYAINMLSESEDGTYLLKLSDGTHPIYSLNQVNIAKANLTIEGSDHTMIRSASQDRGAPLLALSSGTSSMVIKNVRFESYGKYSFAEAVRINASNIVIERCSFTGFDRGIRTQGASDVVIKRSLFFDTQWGVQIIGSTTATTISIQNSFFASPELPTSPYTMTRAVDLSNGGGNLIFEHNTLVDFDGIGVFLYDVTGDVVVRYNVFDNLDVGIRLSGMTDAAKTNIHWNYFNNSTTKDIQALHPSVYTESNNTIDIDPLILTESFRLDPTSPMIDAIDDVTDLVTEDIEGRARPYSGSVDNKKDIGCWEYYPRFTVSFVAGENGSIHGDPAQEIYAGDDGFPVTANPDAGYEFDGWSGDYVSTENPLTITDVAGDMTITANFILTEVTDEDVDEVSDEDESVDNIIDEDVGAQDFAPVDDDSETPDEVADETTEEIVDETETPDDLSDEDSESETIDETTEEAADETEISDEDESGKKSSGCSTLMI